MDTSNKLIVVLVLFLIIVTIGPLLTIWSLNTLFPILNIPYTLESWAAVVILGGAISLRSNKKD
jgi:hypothetical protein